MAQNLFSLDGKYYNLRITEISRDGNILDGENAGRTLSGLMDRDIIGTYYNYTITIDSSNCDKQEYDEFYELITSPDYESHDIIAPYGQKTLKFKAYISNVSDKLTYSAEGFNRWKELSFKCVALAPIRKPKSTK